MLHDYLPGLNKSSYHKLRIVDISKGFHKMTMSWSTAKFDSKKGEGHV